MSNPYRKPWLPAKKCPPQCDDDYRMCEHCPDNPGLHPDPCPVCGARWDQPCDKSKHGEGEDR